MKNSQAKAAYKNHTERSNDINNVKHTKGKDSGKRKPEARGSYKNMSLHEPDIDSILGFDTKDKNAANAINMPTRFSSGNSVTNKIAKSAPKIRPSTAVSLATNRDGQHRDTAFQTADRAARKDSRDLQPTLRTIDKVMIDATLSAEQIESAIEVCKQWVRDTRAIRITNQSGFWRAMFVYFLDESKSTEHSKNPSVTLYFESKGHNSNVSSRLQLNPHHLDAQHVTSLIAMWQKLFSFDWRDVRRAARFYRSDEASDFIGSLDTTLLDRHASQVRDNYFSKTNRNGKIQTTYIGEATALSRGTIYDRDLAELFRNDAGQSVPLNRETATHVLEHQKKVSGLIRVESRRVFEPKLTYAELTQTPSAFCEFNVFDLSRLRPRDRRDTGFMLYVEWVRLRGVHGAKHRLFEMQGKTAETKRLITDYEQRLGLAQCEWWTQLDREQQLGALLEKLPVNKFLKYIGR